MTFRTLCYGSVNRRHLQFILSGPVADQIEILKGPSTLLYGSGAIGGVVNVVDGRIPQTAPANGFSGRTQINYDSVSDGGTAMFRVDGGGDGFALHADGLDRHDNDYDIPGGTLDNSWVHTKAGALGGSLLGDWGYVGLAVERYLNDYGSPAEPGNPAEGEPPVRIGMEQTRYDLKGALNNPLPAIDKAELSFGHTDYQHIEFEGDEAGTTFTNDANEGRLLFTHAPLADWLGAFGVQAFHRDFAALGEESFVPPTTTKGIGLFVTEQKEFGAFKLDLGARGDNQSSKPEGGSERDFHPLSLSGGLAWRFHEAWHLTVNLDRAQRAPAEEELFANGPHLASETFEIGDPNLKEETANQIEPGLHYHGEWIEAKVAAYYNRYDDFIYPWNTSSAEEIQKRFPRARVVGAFKNVWWEVFDQPKFDGGLSDVYVVTDHDASRREFLNLVDGAPFRFIDAGRLYNARFVERMTLFAAELGQRQGYFPRMNWRLLGEPWTVGKVDRVGHLIARN